MRQPESLDRGSIDLPFCKKLPRCPIRRCTRHNIDLLRFKSRTGATSSSNDVATSKLPLKALDLGAKLLVLFHEMFVLTLFNGVTVTAGYWL